MNLEILIILSIIISFLTAGTLLFLIKKISAYKVESNIRKDKVDERLTKLETEIKYTNKHLDRAYGVIPQPQIQNNFAGHPYIKESEIQLQRRTPEQIREEILATKRILREKNK